MPLLLPAADFGDLPLQVRKVSVTTLKRIGRHRTGEPYFGRHGAYRFDDPGKHFGTCYCGQHLDTAIAETVLHDDIPVQGQFHIAQSDIAARYLVTFAAGAQGGVLRLADLTGPHLKRLGGDNSLSADYPYTVTQQWSAAVHAHPRGVDGFIFVSRQLNDRKALVVFDRARAVFGAATCQPLAEVPGLRRISKRLGIVLIAV